jgi:hypothetical protein
MAIKKNCPLLIRIATTIAIALAEHVTLVTLISAAFPFEDAEILDPWGKSVQD